MSIRINIKRQEDATKEAYWQNFEYSGELHVSIGTLINNMNSEMLERDGESGRYAGTAAVNRDCAEHVQWWLMRSRYCPANYFAMIWYKRTMKLRFIP